MPRKKSTWVPKQSVATIGAVAKAPTVLSKPPVGGSTGPTRGGDGSIGVEPLCKVKGLENPLTTAASRLPWLLGAWRLEASGAGADSRREKLGGLSGKTVGTNRVRSRRPQRVAGFFYSYWI